MNRVLMVEDDQDFAASVQEYLQERGIELVPSATCAQALHLASSANFAAAVVDQVLPDGDGTQLCAKLLAITPKLRVIFATAYPSYELARKAIHLGAFDYLAKPFAPEELLLSVTRALEFAQLQDAAQRYYELQQRKTAQALVLERQKTLKEQLLVAKRAAVTDAPVLILGETGTGKGLLARYIHAASARAQGPFVAVNCAGVPDSLFESEFFGYEKGAFTGAASSRPGLFEQASGGTLFVDEIAELSPSSQAKLLTALEERNIRRLGSRKEIPVNVRIIAATNKNVSEALASGTLRQDLYFRLSVVIISLPPLRERLEELPTLARTLLQQITGLPEPPGLAQGEWEILSRYHWPGNIRELKNLLERAWILQGEEGPLRITPFLPLGQTASHWEKADPQGFTGLLPLQEVEKRHVLKVLDATGGNISQAARVLGVSLSTLKRRLKKFRTLHTPSSSCQG